MPSPNAILIAGPTASGKSALALALAQDRGGVVINADSMQVYRDLAILTARPGPQECAAAPHRLYGEIDAADAYSAGRWAAAAAAAIAAARAAGRLPIVVGGTGLYFKALTEGLSDMPAVPAAVRAAVRGLADGQTSAALHAHLAARDPATAAQLKPGDRQRVMRALEVLEATGRPLHAWQAMPRRPVLDGTACVRLFLDPAPEALRARIDARFAAMIAAGARDEVARLAARRLDPALPAMRAHGVPALLAHLAGDMSLADAIARGQADTRAYARRQRTWFRHQMPGWARVAPADALAHVRMHLR